MIRWTAQIRIYLFSFLFSLLLAFFIFDASANNINKNSWQETECKFSIDETSYDNKKKTLIEAVAKEEGIELKNFIEKDTRKIKIFSIQYNAPMKFEGDKDYNIKDVNQFGIYKSLNAKIRSQIEKNSLDKIMIKYDINNPISIQFIINGEAINAPAMATKAIDDQWKENK